MNRRIVYLFTPALNIYPAIPLPMMQQMSP
jgi:hypothetical protein